MYLVFVDWPIPLLGSLLLALKQGGEGRAGQGYIARRSARQGYFDGRRAEQGYFDGRRAGQGQTAGAGQMALRRMAEEPDASPHYPS